MFWLMSDVDVFGLAYFLLVVFLKRARFLLPLTEIERVAQLFIFEFLETLD